MLMPRMLQGQPRSGSRRSILCKPLRLYIPTLLGNRLKSTWTLLHFILWWVWHRAWFTHRQYMGCICNPPSINGMPMYEFSCPCRWRYYVASWCISPCNERTLYIGCPGIGYSLRKYHLLICHRHQWLYKSSDFLVQEYPHFSHGIVSRTDIDSKAECLLYRCAGLDQNLSR